MSSRPLASSRHTARSYRPTLWRTVAALLLVALWLLAFGAPSAAQAGGQGAEGESSERSGDVNADEAPSVLLLIIDRLAVDELLGGELPALQALARSGGVGLLNARVGASRHPGAGYLTFGVGERAVTGTAAGLTFHLDEMYRGEPIEPLYRALTGEAPEGARLLHLGIAELTALAGGQERPFEPGRLGRLLREAGVPVWVYGNADTHEAPQRFAPLIVMDPEGRVAGGDVSAALLMHDPEWPFRLRTDYDALLDAVLVHRDEGGLVVVDLGDLVRLEGVAPLLAPEQAVRYRSEALARIDAFVAELLSAWGGADRTQHVVVVVPQPDASAYAAGFLLTPVIVATLDGAPRRFDAPSGSSPGSTADSPSTAGLITSTTTRREGLGANTDVLPTLLALLGIEIEGFVGRGLQTVASDDAWGALDRLYSQVTRTHRERLPVIQPYFFIQVAAVLITLAVLLFHTRFRDWLPRVHGVARLLHLALVAFPLALLLYPLAPANGSIGEVWLRIGGWLLATVALCVLLGGRRPASAFTLLALITAGALWLDTALGARLIQQSHLGYDPIGGSRYYGIGNEYMGVLIGMAVMGAGGLLDAVSRSNPRGERWVLVLVGLLFAAITFILASPLHGINLGGTITAVIGFGASLTLYLKRRLTWQGVLLTLLCLTGVVALLSWYDLGSLQSGRSHVGSAVQQVASEGSDPLWTLFERKIAVNVRLIRLTIWSRAFFISLLAAVLLTVYPPRLMRRFMTTYPYLGLSVKGSVIAAITTLIVNDSGIVAAATLMIPVVSMLLYLMLRLAVRAQGRDSTG